MIQYSQRSQVAVSEGQADYTQYETSDDRLAVVTMVINSTQKWVDDLAETIGRDLLRFLTGRLSNRQDAEELAQEVYLRLLRVEDVGQIRNPRAFALRIAANVAHEWYHLARNRQEHSSALLADLTANDDPVHDAILQQQVNSLERALQTLSPRCRAVVLLHRRDKLTREEIATQLGISIGMVKKYLAKGVAACQKYLMAEQITSER